MINDLALIFFLILFSAFFSGTETAMFSLGSGRFFRSGESRNQSLIKLKELLKNPDLLLSVVLLGNLTVNIVISHYAHQFINVHFPWIDSNLFSLIVITAILLLTGEILPKVVALRHAEKWSLAAASPVTVLIKLTGIISGSLNRLTGLVTSLVPEKKHMLNESELLDTLRFALNDRIIGENEFGVLRRTIHFYHDTAYDIMIPKSALAIAASDDTIRGLRKIFLTKKQSMALVFDNKENRFTGYISARSILHHMGDKKAARQSLVQPLIFMPETLPLNEVMEEMIKNQLEVAAIIDEMGELSGVITMKDIYHTLLGSFEETAFYDENSEKNQILKLKKAHFRVHGQTTIREFNDYFNADLVSENSETISGYLIERLDGYPQKNTTLEIRQFRFYNMILKNNTLEFVSLQVKDEH